MLKQFILLTIAFSYYTTSFSQITITDFDKKIEREVLKPPSFDSTKKYELFDVYKSDEQFSQYDPTYPKSEDLYYKQYIGLKVYLPPCQDEELKGFYSTTPSFVKLDKPANYFNQRCDSVMTFIYKPTFIEEGSGFVSKTEYDADMVGFFTNCKEVANKYYTVIDFLNQDSLISVRNNMNSYMDSKVLEELKTFSPMIKDEFLYGEVGFVIKDDASGDTLLSLGHLDKFVLVPYFVKQQQMFNGKAFTLVTTQSSELEAKEYLTFKDLITNKDVFLQNNTEWNCEVTLLDYNKIEVDKRQSNNKQNYTIAYILRNGTQTIALTDIDIYGGIQIVPYLGIQDKGFGRDRNSYAFILSDVYAKQEAEKKLKREALLAKQKQDEVIRINKAKAAKEKFRIHCIEKFGQPLGEIIAQGKVRIGMTTDMCETAWGKPFDKFKTTTASRTTESWYYGWKRSLYFENGTLVQIKE